MACLIHSRFRHRTASLAPSGTDHGDHPAVYRRFYPGQLNWLCKWAYALCLYPCAGTVFPYCKRQPYAKHHVYWKPAKRHGSFYKAVTEKKTDGVSKLPYLSDCYRFLYHWPAPWRTSDQPFSHRTIWISYGLLILCFY